MRYFLSQRSILGFVIMKNKNLLLFCAKVQSPLVLTVEGNSMMPLLHPGDKIFVRQKEVYEIGDILVFAYKNDEILVHRLLKTENGRYFLKGDNSFRIEDILFEQIIGTVYIENDPNKTEEFIMESLAINSVFCSYHYNAELVYKSIEYQNYSNKYLNI